MFHLLCFSQLKKCSEFPSGLPFCSEKTGNIFFAKYLSKRFQPGGQGGCMKAYPAPRSPQDPTERERCSQPCGKHPLAAGRGCPTQPWLPRPTVSVSPCGSATPNPSRCFLASPTTQSHPRAAQPCGKAAFAHCLPLPRAGDTSHLACISSTAISKPTARSCPGTRSPMCHRCHWCALAGERRAESPQQHPGHGRGCAHGAAPGAARGNRRGLGTYQGGDKAPMPTTGP